MGGALIDAVIDPVCLSIRRPICLSQIGFKLVSSKSWIEKLAEIFWVWWNFEAKRSLLCFVSYDCDTQKFNFQLYR